MADTDQTPPPTKPEDAKRDIEEWPNPVRTREELDSALEAGLESGISPYSIEEITERVLDRLKNS